MRLLLDTNVMIALARGALGNLDASISSALAGQDTVAYASVASLWEIAIKTRIGKLDVGLALADLPDYFKVWGLSLLVIDHRHVLTAVDPEPPTRDPFDRLLLAQCAVEDLRLMTLDRKLAGHPLAWRPA
jgi:PIN domain nuclease of toxin-antitoxin system